MSRETYTSKKRRLESEQSETSGITLLSNITQTTELSSDLEDNNSDSSSTNQSNAFYGSRSNVTNDVKTQVDNPRARDTKKALRKRQVSWSLDDDETFVKEVPIQPRPVAPYDNNFAGTNNSRRRTRRATESSLDNHALSFNQPQSPFNGQCESCNHLLRSNTTSLIHGHENEIQRQRMIEDLIREHDSRALHQRHSQSVTSLRAEGTQIQPGSHMYESLQNQRTAPVIANRPVDTVVTINPDKNYIHPTPETKVTRNMKIDAFARLNKPSEHSCDESSAYADVIRYSESSTESGNQTFCLNNCKNSFYRKGFFALLVLNVILVLLNSFGLPFVYFAIKQEEKVESNNGGRTGALTSEICLECDLLILKAKQVLDSSNVTINKNNQCCFKSSEQLLPALLKAVAEVANSSPADKMAKVPVIQLKADKKKNYDTEATKVIWERRAEINTMGAEIVDNKIRIKKTGYYYVYSRVHYEKTKDELNNNNKFTIGHSVKKISNGKETLIDEIEQRCFPSSSPGDVRHTNHLGSVQHLQEGDLLYLNLYHKQYFDHNNTLFGMFLVAT